MIHFRSSVLICSGGSCWVRKNAALIAGGTSTHVPHFRYFVTQFPLTAGTTKTVVLPVLRRAATPKLGQLIPGSHDHGQQAYPCEEGNFAWNIKALPTLARSLFGFVGVGGYRRELAEWAFRLSFGKLHAAVGTIPLDDRQFVCRSTE
jgi:hypothetical protein